MGAALEFDRVSIRYPGSREDIVSCVSLRIERGEHVALFGRNGSGKTTLLLAAAGLVSFDGSVVLDGIAVEGKNVQEARDRLGFLFNVPEDQLLFPRVLDDVAYGLIRRGVRRADAEESARAILETLGAKNLAEASPFQLSHGQRQRIALAGALVTNPPLLLLDEPSSALDPRGRIELADLLMGLDSAFLIATHDVEFAASTCSRYLFLDGPKVSEGSDFTLAKRLLIDGVE